MKDIIKNILDIENKANKIIDEGIAEKQQLINQMNEEIEKMRADIQTMVRGKLEQLDNQEKEEAAKSIERINATAEKRLAAMESLYKENSDEWVDSVFNIVIGSDAGES